MMALQQQARFRPGFIFASSKRTTAQKGRGDPKTQWSSNWVIVLGSVPHVTAGIKPWRTK